MDRNEDLNVLDEVIVTDAIRCKEDTYEKKFFSELEGTIGKIGRVVYINIDKSAVIVRFDDLKKDYGYALEEIEKI